MKLHRYLEQLLGNKVSISVLRTLVQYKGKIFTIRRLAHDADVSHPGVSKTVGELEKFGIVQIQPVGRSHQVSLNEKSHVLKKIIEPMFMAEKQTIDQVILILKRHLSTKKIISSVVFGSVSSSQEKEDSDIDVFIVSNDFDHAIIAVSNAGQEIFAKFHSKVSPLVFSESEFKSKKKSDLVRSLLDNHITIYGKNLKDILK
jgi:predicted nucleotidyltransferase